MSAISPLGVSIEGLSGRVDNNGLKINGRIEGYTPEAPLALKVTSFTTENLTIPASPRYIGSLPGPVREFYEQLRPEGTCRLTADISRPTAGVLPEISGRLDIINGRFLYSKFPYPLRDAETRIRFDGRKARIESLQALFGDGRIRWQSRLPLKSFALLSEAAKKSAPSPAPSPKAAPSPSAPRRRP